MKFFVRWTEKTFNKKYVERSAKFDTYDEMINYVYDIEAMSVEGSIMYGKVRQNRDTGFTVNTELTRFGPPI